MWHKAPCSSRDYSGVRESGLRKIDEDGNDDDGDAGEDDHCGDDSPPDGTPAPPRERGGEVLPVVLPPPRPPPGWGEVPPLFLGLHGDDGPFGILPHGLR